MLTSRQRSTLAARERRLYLRRKRRLPPVEGSPAGTVFIAGEYVPIEELQAQCRFNMSGVDRLAPREKKWIQDVGLEAELIVLPHKFEGLDWG